MLLFNPTTYTYKKKLFIWICKFVFCKTEGVYLQISYINTFLNIAW